MVKLEKVFYSGKNATIITLFKFFFYSLNIEKLIKDDFFFLSLWSFSCHFNLLI